MTAATGRPAATCCGRSHGGARRADAFPPRIVDGLIADRLVARTGELLHLP